MSVVFDFVFHAEAPAGALPEEDVAALRALLVEVGAAASRTGRVPEDVVCVVRGPDGTPAGASTVVPADLPLIGGQRLDVYSAVLRPEARDAADALLSATFAARNAAFEQRPEAAIGLCVLVADRAEMARRPEARWTDPPLLYAGYLDDGRQVRLGYYELAQLRRG